MFDFGVFVNTSNQWHLRCKCAIKLAHVLSIIIVVIIQARSMRHVSVVILKKTKKCKLCMSRDIVVKNCIL